MVHVHNVGLVGLLEMIVKAPKLGALYVNMFKGWCFTSNISWHDGGQNIVAWNPCSFSVNKLKCTSQLIHLQVSTLYGEVSFFTTFVYAFNEIEGRKELWADLKLLATQEPWMVLGDFNEILFKEERVGKRVKFLAANEFMDCVEACQIEDIKYSGSYYTWNNKRQGNERIYSKIARVLTNQRWMDSFSTAEALFLAEKLFDHTPAIISLYHETLNGKKPFKYFMWTSHLRYSEIVKGVCNQRLLKGLNSFLYQKAKLSWVTNGDDNTSVFHAIIKERRRANNILSIEDQRGVRTDNPGEIFEAFLSFYYSLLSSKMENKSKIKAGVMKLGPLVSKSQAEFLMKEFFKEDVKKVVFSIPVVKASGPDGFTSCFFQDNWDLIGDDILEAILSFLHSGQILKEINTTVLTLIPKCKCPNSVSDFRPIACCNVIYKVATKLICSRLKVILPELIAQI
ncbi:hypothetical protein CsatB_023646 [Cannabis sativa]